MECKLIVFCFPLPSTMEDNLEASSALCSLVVVKSEQEHIRLVDVSKIVFWNGFVVWDLA